MPLDYFGDHSNSVDEIEKLRAENSELQQQNQRLAEEVKQLVKTENRLCQFQAKLDKQVQHYQQLYKLGKVFNQTFDLRSALIKTAQCLVYDYNFERCLIWMPSKWIVANGKMESSQNIDSVGYDLKVWDTQCDLKRGDFQIYVSEGYYDSSITDYLATLSFSTDSTLFQKLSYQDIWVINDDTRDEQLLHWCGTIGMDECIVFFLKTDSHSPMGIMAMGNTAGAKQYHNRVTEDPDELVGLANLASQVVAAINNIHFYQALQQQQLLLEKKVQVRTHALNAKNKSLEVALRTLQQTQAQLIQSEKMSSLGQLVAGVAHEINNPVNFIDGNLQYFQDIILELLNLLGLYQSYTPDPNKAIAQVLETLDIAFLMQDLPKSISSMQTGVSRIQEIVQSLQTFSRMDEAVKKSVDIHEGIDSTLMILDHRLKPQQMNSSEPFPGIKIIKDYGNLPEVECYAGQLNQVLMNLLSNAIDSCIEKYGRPKPSSVCQVESTPLSPLEVEYEIEHPTITIQTKFLGNCFTLSITDNGTGMSEMVQAQMFNPFFTTKPVGKGTGMGLSISYQIITERHGGALTCQSTLGIGTSFTICIPIEE